MKKREGEYELLPIARSPRFYSLSHLLIDGVPTNTLIDRYQRMRLPSPMSVVPTILTVRFSDIVLVSLLLFYYILFH